MRNWWIRVREGSELREDEENEVLKPGEKVVKNLSRSILLK